MSTFPINNAPQVYDLNRFRSIISKYGAGLASSCRYVVVLGNNPSLAPYLGNFTDIQADLTFLCEQAEFPGKSLNVMEARYYGPNFKYPIQTMYTDITLNFILRDEMYEKEFFDRWMMGINPNNKYDFNYKSEYTVPIDIIQYSMANKSSGGDSQSYPTYKITLTEAFPIAVEPLGLMWNEEGFHRLSVQFAFTEWKKYDDPVNTNNDNRINFKSTNKLR